MPRPPGSLGREGPRAKHLPAEGATARGVAHGPDPVREGGKAPLTPAGAYRRRRGFPLWPRSTPCGLWTRCWKMI